MVIHSTSHPKLFVAKGSIFDFQGGDFDGIIVFLENGFNDINAEYLEATLKEWPYPVLSFGNYGEFPYPQYITNFRSEENAMCFIILAINNTLSALSSLGCRRIGIHGIRINGINDYYTEATSFNAIRQWVCRNSNKVDFVMAVDRFDCYYKHI